VANLGGQKCPPHMAAECTAAIALWLEVYPKYRRLVFVPWALVGAVECSLGHCQKRPRSMTFEITLVTYPRLHPWATFSVRRSGRGDPVEGL
jgi:hypothetical protein